MKIGVPKEIKNHEYRVGLTPAGAQELIDRGHEVSIETNAGLGIGYSDEDYKKVGASIAANAQRIFDDSELIIKVKEPQPTECLSLRKGQILFTYLHLAPDPEQTRLLVQSGVTAVAYETVTDKNGGLPLLAPMSEVAGRLSAQEGAFCLKKANGGSGVLMGGVPGVEPAKVCVIGGGVVGLNAAQVALGMGADVTILDRSLPRLKQLDEMYNGRIKTVFSTRESLEAQLAKSDLVIGAVLIPGASAPKLVTRDMLGLMKQGSVLVDVAIDQGGCFETSRPTTHQDPTYIVDGIVHYCVANMPGAVARTSTLALTNATMPYIMALADKGLHALLEDEDFARGLNVHRGIVTNNAVAKALSYSYVVPKSALQDMRESA